jgi:hypothetical protein
MPHTFDTLTYPGEAMRKAGILLVCGAVVAVAQYLISARAGLIHFAAGEVYIDDRPIERSPKNFPVLKEGQVLRTGRGRVELLLSPSVFLRLGDRGILRMMGTRLDDARVELQKGTALVEVIQLNKEDRVQIELAETSTELRNAGLYRFEAEAGELRVFNGEAIVQAAEKQVSAGRGTKVALRGDLSSAKFDRKNHDAFHEWAARRSFGLFFRDPDAHHQQTRWEYISLGWFTNSDFGTKIRVRVPLRDLVSQEDQKKAQTPP